MDAFRFHIPTEILFGSGMIKRLPNHIKKEHQCIMIVTDQSIHHKTSIINQIKSLLDNKQVLVFDSIEENPSYQSVEEGSNMAISNHIDLIIGVGGGSSMDAAKGIAISAKSPATIKRIVEDNLKITNALPIICLPTSSGTGSEVTPFAVFSDPKNKTKNGFEHKLLFPITSIIDPELSYSMPKKVVINTGLDALAHCIEAYLSKESFELNNRLALEGIKIIIEHLEKASTKDHSSMIQLSYASMLGGIVISHAGTILPHIMGYPLTIYHGVEHGKACILLLPAFIDYLKHYKLEVSKINLLEQLFESKGGLKLFIKSFGLSTNLRDLGVKESEFEIYAQKTIIKGDIKITPGKITEDLIRNIYLKSMN